MVVGGASIARDVSPPVVALQLRQVYSRGALIANGVSPPVVAAALAALNVPGFRPMVRGFLWRKPLGNSILTTTQVSAGAALQLLEEKAVGAELSNTTCTPHADPFGLELH